MKSNRLTCSYCGDEIDVQRMTSSHADDCKAQSSRKLSRTIDTYLRHDLKLALIRGGLVYCYQVRRARDSHLLLLHRIGPANLKEIRRTKGLRK